MKKPRKHIKPSNLISSDRLMCDEIKDFINQGYSLKVNVYVYDGDDHLLRHDEYSYRITNMYGALCYYHRCINLYRGSSFKALVTLQLVSPDLFDQNDILYCVC